MGFVEIDFVLKTRRCILIALVFLSNCAMAVGDRYDSLQAGDQIFRNVTVKSVNATSLVILHSGGLAQVDLDRLSEDLQEKYGYDPEKAEKRRYELKLEAQERSRKPIQTYQKRQDNSSDVSTILSSFGQEPQLRELVDLRPKFNELDLSVRSQGRRPSCAVFAVVSALEYQNAAQAGKAEKLSEEYLIWATMKTLGRYDISDAWSASERSNDGDAGFYLPEVVQALRAYGIPLREKLPYSIVGHLMNDVDPSEELIRSARSRAKISYYKIPGRTKLALIGNLIHPLNAGVPVVIGLAWPHYKTLLRNPTLSQQKPREGYAHAVTIVGYKCPTGKKDDLTFIFRNSWGRKWGAGGYGFIKMEYLEKHLFDAIVLETQKSS